VCNLSACKGACCIDGDAGAPLDAEETKKLQEIYPKVKPFLRKEGIAAIEAQGTFITTEDGELETPLINGADCAYVTFDNRGTALCGIEEAYNQGEIDWKKPVSCELYPVRAQKMGKMTALNYHEWDICDPACELGKQLDLPVYKFVKNALVKKYGKEWYEELEEVAENYLSNKNK
jgi:hypothetical protein